MSGRAPAFLAREGGPFLVLLIVAAGLLAALPFGRLVVAALSPGGVFAPGVALEAIVGRQAVLATLHTVETALLSSLGAVLIGAPFALALTLTDIRAKPALAFFGVLALLVAPQVIALAFRTLAGPASPLLGAIGLSPAPGTPNPMLGRGGVVLVLALHHAPLVMTTLLAGIRRLPAALVEAALIDGATPVHILGRILGPLLAPHLIAGAALALVAAIGNFGIPAILGSPAGYLTLPTLIYRRLSSFGPSIIHDVAALSLLVAALAGIGIVLSATLLRRAPATIEADRPLAPFWRLGRARALVEAGLWGFLAATLFLPLASLVAAALVPAVGVALSPATATLDRFAEVLVRQPVTLRAFRNSFLLAGGAAALLVVVSVPLAYGITRLGGRTARALGGLLDIPYALPGVVLAIACILLFLRPLPLVGLGLYGTPWIILFAYLARFAALALKAPLAAMAGLSLDAEEAAALDGAGALRRLRHVVWPALAPSSVAGGLLVFLLAFNELTVSALLWSQGSETVGIVLFSFEEAGLTGEAAAVALLATGVAGLAMLGLDRLGRRLPDGVLPWRP